MSVHQELYQNYLQKELTTLSLNIFSITAQVTKNFSHILVVKMMTSNAM